MKIIPVETVNIGVMLNKQEYAIMNNWLDSLSLDGGLANVTTWSEIKDMNAENDGKEFDTIIENIVQGIRKKYPDVDRHGATLNFYEAIQ